MGFGSLNSGGTHNRAFQCALPQCETLGLNGGG